MLTAFSSLITHAVSRRFLRVDVKVAEEAVVEVLLTTDRESAAGGTHGPEHRHRWPLRHK
jgi:hypothetical protein